MKHYRYMRIDREWFEEMIKNGSWEPRAEQNRTLRQFAFKVFKSRTPDEDNAAAGYLTRILNGERKMSIEEAYIIAGLFKVSIVEVVKHLGFDLSKDGRPKG